MNYRLITNGTEVKMQGQKRWGRRWDDIKEAKEINTGNTTPFELAEMFLASLDSKDGWAVMRGPFTDRRKKCGVFIATSRRVLWFCFLMSALSGFLIVYEITKPWF